MLEWEADSDDSPKVVLDPERYSEDTRKTVNRMDLAKINYDLIEQLLIHINEHSSYSSIQGSHYTRYSHDIQVLFLFFFLDFLKSKLFMIN